MIKTDTSGDEVEVTSLVLDIIEKKPSEMSRGELEQVVGEMSQDLEKVMSWYKEWRDRAVGEAEVGLMDQIDDIRA